MKINDITFKIFDKYNGILMKKYNSQGLITHVDEDNNEMRLVFFICENSDNIAVTQIVCKMISEIKKKTRFDNIFIKTKRKRNGG